MGFGPGENSRKAEKRAKQAEDAAIAAALESERSRRGVRIGRPQDNEGRSSPPPSPPQDDPNDKGKGKDKGKDKGKGKKKKGRSHVLPPKKKPPGQVEFNKYGQPVGPGSSLLVSQLGLWVREHIPITYDNWHRVPEDLKDSVWDLMKQRYPDEDMDIVKMKKKMAKILRDVKAESSIQIRGLIEDGEKAQTIEQVEAIQDAIQSARPWFCPEAVWDEFVKKRQTPEWKAISEKARTIRASQRLVHRSSRMGMGRLGHKLMSEAEDPTKVTRPYIWTKGYLGNQTEEQVDPELRGKIDEIREYEQTPEGQRSSGIHDDAITHIFGPEHPGRVRGMGFGVTPSQVNVVCGASRGMAKKEEQWNYMMQTMQAMQAALDAHGISVDGFRSSSMSRENATAATTNPASASAFASAYASASASAAASQSMPNAAPNPQMHNSALGKVQLLHYLNHAIVVGVGTFVSFDPTVNVHNVPVGDGNCKVWVDESLIACVPLFQSTAGASIVDETVGSTVAWPIQAIRPLP